MQKTLCAQGRYVYSVLTKTSAATICQSAIQHLRACRRTSTNTQLLTHTAWDWRKMEPVKIRLKIIVACRKVSAQPSSAPTPMSCTKTLPLFFAWVKNVTRILQRTWRSAVSQLHDVAATPAQRTWLSERTTRRHSVVTVIVVLTTW